MKSFVKKHFPYLFFILSIIKNYIINKNKNYKSVGFISSTQLPFDPQLKNLISRYFLSANDEILKRILNKEFRLLQIENFKDNYSFDDVLNNFNELTYRHYYIFYSAYLAFSRTSGKFLVECGVGAGMSAFFCMSFFSRYTDSKLYLYDSFSRMRKEDLKFETENDRENSYAYLSIDQVKKNLVQFKKQIIFNQGYIPETFKINQNPKEICWLHIDLDSASASLDALKFFYNKIEKNGIILINSYGIIGHHDLRRIVEDFFEKKNVFFLILPTGQALILKNT
jgi:hypothetical protein